MVLHEDGIGYQKTFYDGCSQTELKFQWKMEREFIIFYHTLIRRRNACDEVWEQWDDSMSAEQDAFAIERLGNNEFILTSQYENYQEKWIEVK